MTINIHRETAQILAFPLRLRRKLDNGTTAPAGMYDLAASVVDANCWYHDEATREVPKPERPKPC